MYSGPVEVAAMRGYAAIGLDNPKTPANIGSVLRAAGCYQASMVALGGPRPSRLKVNKCMTDTQKAYRHIPTLWVDDLHDVIPTDCVPVAVDLIDGAIPLTRYVHPERAFYVFGAEDATLGKRVLSWCRDVVYVPTRHCMNLAAAVNVILYDRMAKSQPWQDRPPAPHPADSARVSGDYTTNKHGQIPGCARTVF